jgi:hypothetical protein
VIFFDRIEANAETMYILLKGKVKDFSAKTLDELEEDYKRKNPKKPTRIIFKTPSQEIAIPKSLKIPIKQPEENQDAEDAKSNSTASDATPKGDAQGGNPFSLGFSKRLSVIKSLLPLFKKDQEKQSSSDIQKNLRYKKLIQKKRPSLRGTSIDMKDLEKQVDIPLMEQFLKKKNAYFIGNLLKVKFMNFLYPGDTFGVLALKENSLRRRAIIAATNCKLLAITRDDFQKVLEAEKNRLSLKKKIFGGIFNRFSQGQTMLFSHFWSEEHFKLNDIIYDEGEKADTFYLIGEGEVLVKVYFLSLNFLAN